MNRSLRVVNTEEAVWEAVKDAMLNPEKLYKSLEAATRGRSGKKDRSRTRAVLARLEELRKRRSGLKDLAADGLLPKAELAERLAPLDAEITALADEPDEARREENRRTTAEDARILVRRLKTNAPKMLEGLDAAQRRGLYERLGLKVVANLDRSLTMTWMAGAELGELRCLKDRTSTR